MGKIKDSLNRSQTYTLEQSEVEFMTTMHSMMQAELDRIQNVMAASFLRYIAVNRFEYPPEAELRFNFDSTKRDNNLEITNISQ